MFNKTNNLTVLLYNSNIIKYAPPTPPMTPSRTGLLFIAQHRYIFFLRLETLFFSHVYVNIYHTHCMAEFYLTECLETKAMQRFSINVISRAKMEPFAAESTTCSRLVRRDNEYAVWYLEKACCFLTAQKGLNLTHTF